jgi:hypothetical protein
MIIISPKVNRTDVRQLVIPAFAAQPAITFHFSFLRLHKLIFIADSQDASFYYDCLLPPLANLHGIVPLVRPSMALFFPYIEYQKKKMNPTAA